MLQELVNMANVGLVVVDSRLRILLWNKWMADVTGQDEKTVLGQKADKYFPDIFTPLIIEKINGAVEKGLASNLPISVPRIGRKLDNISVSIHPLSARHVVHSVQPVAEQVVDDQCLVQFTMRDGPADAVSNETGHQGEGRLDFLATVGHQIRTPVNGVLNIAELLRGTELSGEQKKYVNMLVRVGQSLNTFVSELTDLSYLQAGRVTLEEERTDVHWLVQDVVDLFTGAEADGKVRSSLELSADIPSYILTDHQKLRQVLMNVIGNAFKFTSEGQVDVVVRWLDGDEKPNLEIEVADTGVGIPESRLAAIFEKDRSLGEKVSGYYNKTGLGLALSRELIELFGGEIEICSAIGKGTAVRFRLPVKPAPDAEFRGKGIKFSQGKRAYGRWRILLAEDNPVNQALFKEILGRLGHEVTVVDNGQEAVRTVQVEAFFDVVLMDISMPVMDGMEATSMIRSLPGETGQTPILALTAHALEGDRETFLDAGMDGYQSKPVDPEELQEAIARAIATRKSNRRWPGVKAPEQSEHPANGPMNWLRFPKLGPRRGTDLADQ